MNKLVLSLLFMALAMTTRTPAAAYPDRFVWIFGWGLNQDTDVRAITNLLAVAARSGLNGAVLSANLDSLCKQTPGYFQRLAQVQQTCNLLGLELIPSVFSAGYGGGALGHNRHLAEGLPVEDATFIASSDKASLVPDPSVHLLNGDFENFDGHKFTHFTFHDQPGVVSFADNAVRHGGKTSLRLQNFTANPHGHARIMQQVQVRPRRCYRVSLWVKTEGLDPPDAFQVTVLAGNRSLAPRTFNLPATTDWRKLTTLFNSLNFDKVRLYAGLWGGRVGKVWLDDWALEEIGPLNVLRRPGTPVTVCNEDHSITYIEGKDYAPLEDPNFNFYNVDRNAPPLVLLPHTRIKEGQRLRISWFHPMVIHESQVTLCMAEPALYEIWDHEAKLLTERLHPRRILLNMDEIRMGGTCRACRGRNMAALLGECITRQVQTLRRYSPQAEVYAWSDMLDPNHNAHGDYYLVEGDYTGSWMHVPKDLIMAVWGGEPREKSLRFFADHGFRTLVACYYDADDLKDVQGWIDLARLIPNVRGFMYTPWQRKYSLLPAFGDLLTDPPGASSAREPELPIPSSTDVLSTLNKQHPRLLAGIGDFALLKRSVTENPVLREWHERLTAHAQRVLNEPPASYEIPDGLRLLSTSRRVLDRTYTLALLYRLDTNPQYAARAWKELHAAANFPDWNPRHFLDTAEMTHAFAIGYDWLYDVWTNEQRATLRAAMIDKGLKPAITSYRGEGTYGWWVKAHHNWNQVCNGGIGMGALALGDEEPALAGEILHNGLKSLQLPMRKFAPDGAWSEGPAYWNYAVSYNVSFLAALETALGTDFTLSQIPGFAETGMFPIYLTGPYGRTFNYADGGDAAIPAPQMFWMARKFKRPEYARYQHHTATAHPLDLLWFDPRFKLTQAPDLPLDKYFRGVEVATFRSAWTDRNALFVGFKAGDNKANHSHLDLGTFVLDALGARWAVDMGADNYNLPDYFGKQRWTYYRLRAEGHNTLVINPSTEPDQHPAAATQIVRFESKPARAFAIADLTPAYASQVKKVTRGIAVMNRSQVLLQDEVQADKPAEVWWFFHTPAKVTLGNNSTAATLALGNLRLQARLLSPSQAQFNVMEAQPLATSPNPKGQARNQTVRKLAVHLTGVTDLRLAVLFTPLQERITAPEQIPDVNALQRW